MGVPVALGLVKALLSLVVPLAPMMAHLMIVMMGVVVRAIAAVMIGERRCRGNER